MRALLRPLIALVLVIALLMACSSDDDDRGPDDVTDPGTADALADYWNAGDQVDDALDATADSWETFAALAADPATPAEDALEAAHAFATACSLAAGHLDTWAALELEILPDDGAGKSCLDGPAREAAVGALEAASAAALTGGEALLVAWQVLGGLTDIRTAFSTPDGTIPVNGTLADALVERLEVRDGLIIEAILAGDDRGGVLALEQLNGTDPEARAADYADRDDDDPVKLSFRASVPAWDDDERAQSLALLSQAARGHLRKFGSVGAGGTPLDGLVSHLSGLAELDPAVLDMTLDLRSADTDEPLDGTALVLLHRRDQPYDQPRLALLTEATAQVMIPLPAGRYDVLALADGWARGVSADVVADENLTVTLAMNHLVSDPIILDGVDAPETAGVGMRLDLAAVAASATGNPLSFAWEFRGASVADMVTAGPRCTVSPTAAGDVTAVVTVTDGQGNTRVDSTTIAVKPFAVEVFRTDFLNEQIVDNHLNPGEVDTLQLWIANRGDNDLVGVARLNSREGLDVDLESSQWTLGAGLRTRWKVPITLPVDYDQPRVHLDFSFTVDGETLVQELDYRVDFYTEIDYIQSPVLSRILTVSGIVANPALETAELVIDRDRSQIFALPLNDGVFEQIVILSGASETRRIRLAVNAQSGSRAAQGRAGFMATVQPADFRATLFWDTDGTDVDLWVTDPYGEKCFYAHRTTASGLDLDVDDVTGYGPENITGESSLPPGEYFVQVHYYSDHGTNLDSHCTVLITLHEGSEDRSVTSYEETLSDGDVWDIATVVWDGSKVASLLPPRRGLPAIRYQDLPAK